MICDNCRRELKITTALVELEGDEGATEIEIEYCPECKIISEITVTGYTIEGEG